MEFGGTDCSPWLMWIFLVMLGQDSLAYIIFRWVYVLLYMGMNFSQSL
jgi:hypothetical protein